MPASWFDFPADTDFSLANLPYGIFSTSNTRPRVGMAVGDQILDLDALAAQGLLDETGVNRLVLDDPTLNALIAQGKTVTNGIRARVRELLTEPDSPLRDLPKLFTPQRRATMHLPVAVGDYTDFYSSIEHATNVGKMFRDPENALLPNWRHLPVGYHGRASSIVPSGTPIRRPHGQTLPKGESQPVYGPCRLLDFELEMGFIIGKENALGSPVSTAEAPDHIFGLVLFNDWSARDIQKWEYVPLGPFLGKSFASSMSAWVVPLEALDPFRVAGPEQAPAVLPYLQYDGAHNYDIALEVGIRPDGSEETTVCRSNYRYMYWNMLQQIAHHTVNGCNLRVGDVLASGTISGHTEESYGSMLEISWAGSRSVEMKDGTERKFLQNGDTVIMRGHAGSGEDRVGFGSVTGRVVG